MEKAYRCGIIYLGLVTSNGKIVFKHDGVMIDGGILHGEKYFYPYSKISLVYYVSLLPKIRMVLSDGSKSIAITVSHYRLRKILSRFLQKHISCYKWQNDQNLAAKFKLWRDFWLF